VRIRSRSIVLTRSSSNGIRQRQVSLSVVIRDRRGANTISGGGAHPGTPSLWLRACDLRKYFFSDLVVDRCNKIILKKPKPGNFFKKKHI